MKLEVKVSYRRSHQIVAVETDTIVKARKMAIDKVVECSPNISHSDCTTEIISGINSSMVCQMLKPITGRRLVSVEIEQYAQQLDLKKKYNEFNNGAYYWGEKKIEQLKQILKDEKTEN